MSYIVVAMFLVCSFFVIYAMRSKLEIESNAVLSVFFYCGGVAEILLNDVGFPKAMIYAYVGLITVNHIIHDKV